MVYVIVLVLLVGTVWLVAGPLLRSRPDATGGSGGVGGMLRAGGDLSATDVERAERRIDLEAARDAKYREIRDADLDHRTGKLSDADYDAVNSTLRAEALELLRELDTFEGPDDPYDPDSTDDLELDDLGDADDPDDPDAAQ